MDPIFSVHNLQKYTRDQTIKISEKAQKFNPEIHRKFFPSFYIPENKYKLIAYITI